MPIKDDDLYVTSTDQVTQASFTIVTRWRKGDPQLSVDVPGLPPMDVTVQPGNTLTAGRETLRAVYPGTVAGRPVRPDRTPSAYGGARTRPSVSGEPSR